MLMIGTDYHPSFQQIASMDTESGEYDQRRLSHCDGEAERFYRSLAGRSVLVGMEATGHSRWFERLLGELNFELWVGDPAKIRAACVRKQKNDERDAEHLLTLLREHRFPRIWTPTSEQRDLRQLIMHRHRLVQMRTRVKNQLQAVALNEGIRSRRSKLWSNKGRQELEALLLPPWTTCRREDLLQLLDDLNLKITKLSEAIEKEADQRADVRLLVSHPGVGPLTALAYVLTIGSWQRFPSAKHVSSYLGLIPSEHSSGGRQHLGHITKQGNALMRFLLDEAAGVAARCRTEWRQEFCRIAARREKGIARIALARKIAVNLYWMLRRNVHYEKLLEFGSHAG
jgi:transposase